jgi:hypothetical protein
MAASRSPLVRKVNDFGARAIAFYDEQRPRRRTGRRAVASESALHVMGDGFDQQSARRDGGSGCRPADLRAHLRWGKLHAVRTCLGIAGAGAFVCASFLRRVDGKRQISKSA